MTTAIIVHGGAKTIPDRKTHANTKGCLAAARTFPTIAKPHLKNSDTDAADFERRIKI